MQSANGWWAKLVNVLPAHRSAANRAILLLFLLWQMLPADFEIQDLPFLFPPDSRIPQILGGTGTYLEQAGKIYSWGLRNKSQSLCGSVERYESWELYCRPAKEREERREVRSLPSSAPTPSFPTRYMDGSLELRHSNLLHVVHNWRQQHLTGRAHLRIQTQASHPGSQSSWWQWPCSLWQLSSPGGKNS